VPVWLAYLVHAAAAAAAAGIVIARRRGRRGPSMRALEIATAVGAAGSLLLLTSGPVFIDFLKAYLYAGRAVLTDSSTLYDCTRAQCFVNIPIVALLFLPFAPMDDFVASVLFSVIGMALLAAAVRRLTRDAPEDLIVWLTLLSGPLYYSVRIGNTTHMLLLPLIVAFDRLARGRQTMAGVLLAGLALLKPPLALFLPYFVVRRNFRAAMVMAGCAAFAVAASIALFGVELHRFWFREFVVEQGSGPIGAYNVQSVNGFLAHLLTRGHLRDWYPIAVGPGVKVLSAGLTFLLLAAATIGCWRAGPPRSEVARRAELWLVLCLTVLIAPISWTHYYVLLVIPIAALVARYASLHWRTRAALATAITLIAPPVVVLGLAGRIGNALYERILISHYFFGGVLLLGVLIGVRVSAAGRTPHEQTCSAGPLGPGRAAPQSTALQF
jgi:Glycosyltransferase family 87